MATDAPHRFIAAAAMISNTGWGVARDWRIGTPFPTARLADTGGFLGLDGPFRFGQTGVIERALEVREARAGTVAVVSPAPDKFAD